MGRQTGQGVGIRAERVRDYLRAHGYADAEVTDIRPLGEHGEGGKEYGYGKPLRITFQAGGEEHRVVLRTMSPDPFGHDRRADRVAEMVLSRDTFGDIPRHIRPLDVGTLDDQGRLVPMADGEPWLLTNYVDGRLYAGDLADLAGRDHAGEQDLARARSLAAYLADLHAERADPDAWRRSLRDTVGSGEGIFGLCDSYPDDQPVATPERIQAIEAGAVRWRWELKGRARRARRVHGDFHPFNLLFREGVDFTVLDCSRGGAGEPADDVTCLSVNYLFFGLQADGRFEGAHRELWDAFWSTYLETSHDPEILEVVAPWFTWRTLVLASPVWYPDVSDGVRDALLGFAERLLEGLPFQPGRIEEPSR
ncbi:MAG: phosphotransferase family protein [Myxococcota bacterium]